MYDFILGMAIFTNNILILLLHNVLKFDMFLILSRLMLYFNE